MNWLLPLQICVVMYFIAGCRTLHNQSERSPAESDMEVVDFHTHIRVHEDRSKLDEILDKLKKHSKKTKYTIAISEAYRIKESEIGEKIKLRNDLNDDLNQLYGRQSNFLGLCGINLDWKDFYTEAERCLSHQRSIGIKLHMGFLDQRLNKYVDKFRALSKLLHVKRKIMLVHFSTDEKTQLFGQIAKQYPSASFVVAHGAAMQGIDMYKLGELMLDASRKNVFIDTSAFFEMYTNDVDADHAEKTIDFGKNDTSSVLPESFWKKSPSAIKEWHSIGIEQVLFGTDFPLAQLDQINFITDCPYLSRYEQRQILSLNALKLLNYVIEEESRDRL